ncbi:hypothetical protein STVIR_2087 [Streptomyces viridochromogenes Tue57]|uniref:Uncharacterized protein n=1 Tax=Streptomyces viridochromogenes Tue57 TaxID=1160705 RepID=L8PKI7_STRVR|nr:hypothetical protein STVIR_2087 [Streptomyces viridochromogenes Tue57]
MLGYRWPTANEDKLRDCATMWRDFGDTVTELHTKANNSARQVVAHNAGESIDKFSKTYEKFDGGGGSDGYLRNAAQAAYLIANVLESCAYLVEFAKWAVIAQLIALAIEIIAAHAAAPFTFGLSEVAGLGATQVTRLIVRRLLDELKQAMIDALIETMKEPAISAVEAMISDLIRQTVNVGFGAQEGYDIGATMKAGGEAGLDALRQSPQTFAEGVRDSLGQKAGSRARDAIDSRLDGYDGPSGLSGGDGGKDGDSDSGAESSKSSSSDASSSSTSNSNSSDSPSSGPDSSTSTRNGTGPGAGIGGGISADTGGNDIGAPNVGAGPDSGSGSDSGSPSSSDSPHSRPTPSTGPSLSDFDDPSSGGRPPGGTDSGGSSSTPSTSGPSHSGGSPVSGLSSPSPQSAPTPASSGGTSSSPGGGSIGTQIDSLAAGAPTQSNAASAPTTADPSPAGTGSRSEGGSGMPTSPTAPSTGGATPGTHHTPSTSGGTSSATSPNPNSGPARNPAAGTPSATGTGPASTPSPTTPTTPTTPRSTPTPTPDSRIPGTPDGRAPGTPDGRIPTQRTPGSATPGEGTAPRNTPGSTTPGDRTPPGTTPGTTPGDRTPPRTAGDPATGTRTTVPGQNPSTTSPGQNPAQSTPPRTASPTTGSATSTPSPSTGTGPERASTPSNSAPNSSTQPGPTAQGTPGTPNQPSAGSTPNRPPHQPAGSTPNTPGQPGAQPHAQQPPANTPNQQQSQVTPNQQQQSQVTPVPIHHVTPAPNSQPKQSAPQSPDSTSHSPSQQNSSDHPKPKETPTPASETRNTNPPGGVTHPTRAEQEALDNAVPRDENGDPTRPPDPAAGPWVERVNGEGREAPGRNNNCVDVALSMVDTYAGNPTAAASRTPDPDADGNPSDRGEKGGRDRIENTLGARFSDLGNGRDAFNRLENTLRNSGHGSQAVIITQDANGRAHAWNAVNHNGKITYIDAQTGQQSSKPLHSGNNGVFAIPLDSNRQPVAPDTTGTPENRHPSRQASTTPADSDRRPPDDPAGAPPSHPSKFDPEEVRGSAEFGERQTADHTHVDGMPMEESQATLRQTHHVSQVGLGPVLENAHRWAQDGSLDRVVQEAREKGHVTQSRLNEILGKDFKKLNDDQKMAVVAGIARISNTFHEKHAVGNNPIQQDPERRREKGIERGVNPLPGVGMHDNHRVRRGNDANKTGPADVRARRYLVAQEVGPDASKEARDKAHDDFDKLWNDHKDGALRPDMSGKNYAVLEVHEKVGNKTEVHYVIDSSIPTGANYHQDHSEPHLGEWMRQVETAEPGKYKAVRLFTEFEPCGNVTGTGGSNCSDYLSHDREREDGASRARNKDDREKRPEEVKKNPPQSDLRISYGIGYRRGDRFGYEAAAAAAEYGSAAERDAAVKAARKLDNAERNRVKAITDEQMIKYRGEWLRVWKTAASNTE